MVFMLWFNICAVACTQFPTHFHTESYSAGLLLDSTGCLQKTGMKRTWARPCRHPTRYWRTEALV